MAAMANKLRSELSKASSVHLASIIESLICRFGTEASVIVTEKLQAFRQCWVVRLPPDTFSAISSEWLTLVDFCRLDSAFCRCKLRLQFQQCVQRRCLFSEPRTVSKLHQEEFLRWAVLRQIRVSTISIMHRTFNVEVFYVYLKASGDSLRSLDFEQGSYLTVECVQTVTQCCPNLESFSCIFCTNVSPELVSSVLEHCTSLRELDISHVTLSPLDRCWSGLKGSSIKAFTLTKLALVSQQDISNEQLCTIVSTCTRLVDLSIANCLQLDRTSFTAIATHLPHLKLFNASNTHIDDVELVQLVQHCTKLTYLSINDCPGVSNTSLTAILTHSHSVTELYLNHNPHLTNAFLERVHTNLPHLTKFYINGCVSVTPVGVLSVVKNCPFLSVFSVKEYTPEFDEAVRQGIVAGKHWLGTWKDRKLSLYLSTV